MCFGIAGKEMGREGMRGMGGNWYRAAVVLFKEVGNEGCEKEGGSCRGAETSSCLNCPTKEGKKGRKSGKERKWL